MMTTHQPIHKIVLGVDVKTFFYFGHVFLRFLTFFIFQTFFLFLKTLAKFRAANRLARSLLLSCK